MIILDILRSEDIHKNADKVKSNVENIDFF